jgi:ABC-2 type transport system permease protein
MAAVTVDRVSGHAAGRAGLGGVVRSEWTKMRSVRSTYWTLLALVVVSVGLGALIAALTKSHWGSMSPADRASFDPVQDSLFGLVFFGQLIIVVLGALIITSEYSTGMIRTSLTVMPRRGVMFLAKALVFGGVTLVVTLLTSFVAFLLGQALLSPHNVSLSSSGAMRAVIGSAVYVTLCGLLAYAAGSLLRHTAGAITAVIGVLFVLPIIINFLPHSWRDGVDRWLPSSAGNSVTTTVYSGPTHLFNGWGELIVLAAYVAVLLIAGATLFRNRDA